MTQLEKRAGNISLATYLDGHPRWTSLKFHNQEMKSLQPEDLRDLSYAIGRFLAQIDEHDARITQSRGAPL